MFADIEVSPNIVFSWRIGYKVQLIPDNIISERKVICIGYKWEGDKETRLLVWDKDQDDAKMLAEFVEIAKEADEVVAHFGDSFDIPWLRGRIAILGLAPLPPLKTVDTKAWASKYFYFNSNKLDYLGEVFGFGRKIKTDYDLWRNIVLHKCAKALAYMCKYCRRDVSLLEKVYNRLSQHAPVAPRTHAGVLHGREKWTCPHDGSRHVKKDKTKVSKTGVISHQMNCLDCGRYHSVSTLAFNDYQEYRKKCQSVRKP